MGFQRFGRAGAQTRSTPSTTATRLNRHPNLKMIASTYQLLGADGLAQYLAPAALRDSVRDMERQATTAAGVLGELNRRLSGHPAWPCRMLLVFNREDR